jgi:hypothetical protein
MVGEAGAPPPGRPGSRRRTAQVKVEPVTTRPIQQPSRPAERPAERTAGSLVALLRRDPLLGQPRMLFKLMLAGLLLAQAITLWAGVAVYRQRELTLHAGSADFARLLGSAWLILSVLLLALGANKRCTPFDLTLPIRARALWLTRVLVMLGAALAVICMLPPVALLVGRIRGVPGEFTDALFAMIPYLVSGSLLAVALVQARRSSLSEVPLDRPFVLHFALVVLGTLAALIGASRIGPVACAIPAAAGLIVLARTYRALPAAFRLLPRDGVAGRPAPSDWKTAPSVAFATHAAGETPRSRRRAASGGTATILRTLYAFEARMAWAFPLPLFIGMYAVMLSGHFISLGVVQVTWLWALMSLQIVLPLARVPQLDFLPLSRRRIFPWIVLPTLAVAAGSYVIAQTVGDAQQAPVRCESSPPRAGAPGPCRLIVPGSAFEIAPGGIAPPTEGPWGESHTPEPAPIARGLAVAVYNPYAAPPGASLPFVAFQLGRAIERVYGARIPAEELERRYLETRPDGTWGLKPGGLTLQRDYPALSARPRAQIMPAVVLLIGLPWLLLVAWLIRPLADSVNEGVRRRVAPLLMLVPLVCTGIFVFADIEKVLDLDALSAATEIVARRVAGAVPGGSVTLWLLAAGLLAAGYSIAERRFARLEVFRPRESD